MMKNDIGLGNYRTLIIGFLCFTSVLFAPFSFASSAANSTLMSQLEGSHKSVKDRVTVSVWLSDSPVLVDSKRAQIDKKKATILDKYYVNDQIKLYIEVSTPTWFAGGTDIGYIDLPHAIVRQSNQLATNYTTREKGQTWSKQRWEIPLFPQQSGMFTLPSIPVSVIVADENRQKVPLEFMTPSLSFNAVLPSGLLDSSQSWFSATDASIQESWQLSRSELKVGDSVTHTVTIKARDTLSIFLPSMLALQNNDATQAYSSPHELTDQQMRGEYVATRKESRTYVIQKGGELVFPSVHFHWWNSETARVEELVLPGHRLVVKHTFTSYVQEHKSLILMASSFSIMSAFILCAGIWYYRRNPLPRIVSLSVLLYGKKWPAARTLIYLQLRDKTNLLALRQLESNPVWQQDSEALQMSVLSKRKFITMWFQIKSKNEMNKLSGFKCLDL
ncbi:hypothetical protein QWZ04_22235 [Vibrio tapetis subsp. quintayensis]|uniref:hypothetical protein n=1 Tax=Vibrio tapetis TaxID=52443 RepID=UPI0025B46DC1|nr:hypothetical protein [Vibrio tapetis]MDN3683028.1 hypothetical protein [Vibrio tapetis subsp. quintayensis]